MRRWLDNNRFLLASFAALIVASHLQFGLGILAWLLPLPALRYLRRTEGWKPRLGLVALAMVSWTLTVVKIATDPIPVVLAPMYCIPLAVFGMLPYLAYDRFRRGGIARPALFAALVVLAELAQHRLTDFATWGSFAYTQIDKLPLLQMAATTGITTSASRMGM